MGQLTATGYQMDRLVDIRSRIQSKLIEAFGSGFVTTTDNPIIRITDIAAEEFSLLEEGLAAAYLSQFPSSAIGVSLDRAVEITGVARQPATSSTATVYATGTGGLIIPIGSIVSVAQTGDQFQLPLATTLDPPATVSVTGLVQSFGTATATVASHTFLDGDYIFISGAEQEEYNGVFPISNVTATSFDFPVDSGADATATGTIEANLGTPLEFVAINEGPIQALSGSLSVIETPVVGWEQAENYADANLGQNIETDSELRARRVELLAKLGGGTVESIRAELLDVVGVTSAKVFENATGLVDSEGRPPHSVEAFVVGGSDTDIAEALFTSMAAGIESYGTEGPFVVVDAEGINHSYNFSRLTEVLINVYMKITKNTDPNEGPLYPATGDDDIRQSILDYGETLAPGQDLRVMPYIMAAIGAVDGVDLLELYVVKSTGSLPGDPANPGNLTSTIVIGSTELAVFESVKIWVNGSL